MKIKICDKRDFYAGLLFVSFGVVVMIFARNYPMGTAFRMGPGYFPTFLGGLLAVIGFVIMAGALLHSSDGAIGSWALRPLILVSAGVIAFAVLLRAFGLVLALLVLIVISCLADSDSQPREVAVLCLFLVALCVGVFIYGFGLPLEVWPKW